ncbi:hypothetical protein HOP50_02g10930 [Chloropicon primus]|uniref:Sororin C-terminal region domain-containing protein n=1 Tax=Chloropicon primus TaxID=1764295 RepID=A0A5B8MDT3_9CHLO|nr:hypothetical protein A3770_02p11070 [Chloropicon primus]UPQ97798.1 hypothetical protein HOP50_02g10930 [Chloropicon primus]|eukprot:QDZ18589.1 hypothetical protein A3770_02p11070 [Chloropicon primus]
MVVLRSRARATAARAQAVRNAGVVKAKRPVARAAKKPAASRSVRTAPTEALSTANLRVYSPRGKKKQASSSARAKARSPRTKERVKVVVGGKIESPKEKKVATFDATSPSMKQMKAYFDEVDNFDLKVSDSV